MNYIQSMLDDFLSLIYPRICKACGRNLFTYEKCICTFCLYHLPKTNFHLEEDNPVSRLFWGKAVVHSATSLYYFYKGGKVQQLMHQLKYKGQKEIGIYIGTIYGKDLLKVSLFNTAECIIPVPMHPKKQKRRGYNQSEMIAIGLSQSMKIPVDTKTLVKKAKTETQTRKSRFSRWENVKEVFELKEYNHLTNKHVLLVDDVITTGSTIESCILNLAKVPGIKISVVSMACAYH
jgi:ComF family protein